MADPLVDVAVRVYADFADRPTLADVVAVVARARNHLDTPSAAPLPGLVERRAPATARLQPDTVPTPTGESGSSAPDAPCVGLPVARRPRLDDLPANLDPNAVA
jgi:hypothetical protein